MFVQLSFVALWLIASAQHVRHRQHPHHGQETSESNSGESKELFDALQVLYPLRFFSAKLLKEKFNWRSPGVYDEHLMDVSTKDREYLKVSKAQDQEDVWLYENWFFGVRNGIILESGALDGDMYSNSNMFEKFANWTAIHVEADPENFSRLKQNRKNAINVHGALCSEPRLLHYTSSGLDMVRGFVEFMPPSFLSYWHGKIANNEVKLDSLPVVQCLPVKFLLQELNVHHVDIWILDVEGAEESVLLGTDFTAVQINAVAMECDEHDIAKNERKTSILEKNNFVCHLIERNCLCKNKNFQIRSASYRTPLRRWEGGKRYTPYSTATTWF
jgi:FkbM family methyltransferase